MAVTKRERPARIYITVERSPRGSDEEIRGLIAVDPTTGAFAADFLTACSMRPRPSPDGKFGGV